MTSLQPTIIFSDSEVMVIHKPAGLVVNRAESVKEPTVQDWIETQSYFDKSNYEPSEFIARTGVVHRLDKETSGLLMIAKTPTAFAALKQQFIDRSVRKSYLALVHGSLTPKHGTIQLPLKRNPLNRHRFAVSVDGKFSRTEYLMLKYFTGENPDHPSENYTYVQLKPLTGRTHQLRVHLSHLGHPIVADPIYLGKRLAQDLTWCPRLFLHAFQLAFRHPISQESIALEAALPVELVQALNHLTQN